MMDTTTLNIDAMTAAARARMYRFLAKAFLYPMKDSLKVLTLDGSSDALEGFSVLHPTSSDFQDALRQLNHTLNGGEKWLTLENLEFEYNRLFAHLGSAKCPPYETEFGHDNVFQKTQAMADIAGFYYAYGLDVADENAERVDFISTELEFMSFLALNEAYAFEKDISEQMEICLDTQRKFLRDHLGRWISVFVKILMKSTDNRFYRDIGRLTMLFLREEAVRLDVVLEEVTGPNKEVGKVPDPFDCSACTPSA